MFIFFFKESRRNCEQYVQDSWDYIWQWRKYNTQTSGDKPDILDDTFCDKISSISYNDQYSMYLRLKRISLYPKFEIRNSEWNIGHLKFEIR